MAHTLLVIEDDADAARLLIDRFRREGFLVQQVSDAALATQVAQQSPPDVILLDLMLPAGGGLAVLERLKWSAKTNHIPIVVLTGSQDDTHERRAIELGASAYLCKPYDAKELIRLIKQLSSTAA